MAHWLYEDGIGERRAARIERGRIVEVRIERDSDGVQAGALLFGQMISKREGLARLPSGEEVLVTANLPNDGQTCLISVQRSAIPERDLVKRARGEIWPDDPRELVIGPAMPLREGIEWFGGRVQTVRTTDGDPLEDAGWSEVLDSARTGLFPFDGGILRLALTPAMGVFDVDGGGSAYALAVAGAKAAARTCRLLDIGGNIAIDLPSVRQRERRDAIRAAFIAALADDDPHTACLPIDALGLLHVSRLRLRPSIAERMQFAPTESAALALLRRAERSRGFGPLTISAHPAVSTWIEARPALIDLLARRVGRAVVLQADPALSIWGGDAH